MLHCFSRSILMGMAARVCLCVLGPGEAQVS